VIGGKIEDGEGGGGVGKHLLELFDVPGLERVEGGVARLLVRVAGKNDQDLDFLFQGKRQFACGAFAPDDFRSLAFA